MPTSPEANIDLYSMDFQTLLSQSVPFPVDLMENIKELTEGIEVDLNEPLDKLF